jgi:molybdate transport system substrate-binding protein
MSVLRIMSARAVKGAVSAIAAEFSRAADHNTSFDFAPVGTLEAKLAAGAVADVIILSTAALTKIETMLVPGSRRALGRTSIGVAVKAGAALPDIATPEAFRRALLAARSIAVSDIAVGGTAGKHLAQMFERIGIADAIERKVLRCSSGADVTQRVADGEAEIGMTFISEMLPIEGARVVGPLPSPLGSDTTYEAAVGLSSGDRTAAAALIEALTRPDARDLWKDAGFELPMSR